MLVYQPQLPPVLTDQSQIWNVAILGEDLTKVQNLETGWSKPGGFLLKA